MNLQIKRFPLYLLMIFICMTTICAQVKIDFGNNPDAGNWVMVNETKLYYETYGVGQPLLLIHGNGGSIHSMRFQIDFFMSKYKIVVADSRGQGKSKIDDGELNYTQMADDLASLLDHLKIDSARIVGWSDGGILGLLLAIHHPNKVSRLAIMGANLQPDTSAVYQFAIDEVKLWDTQIDKGIKMLDKSKDWQMLKKLNRLLLEQPDIKINELRKITCPVLVMAGDRDFIREEHTVRIFQNIPKAQLCIFPGNTHYVPVTAPTLFNETVYRFLSEPFSMPKSKFYEE